MSDESDYKDYQDYIEYQKHIAGPAAKPSAEQAMSAYAKPKLSPDDFTKAGERIPQEGGLANFMKYNVAHFDPSSPDNMAGMAMGSGGLAKQAGPAAASLVRGASRFLAPAAERSNVLSHVKDVKSLEPFVADRVAQASKAFDSAEIAPRMEQQYAKSHEQMVPFNKEQYAGIHPSIDEKVADLSQYYDKEIPMSEALKLRSQLNDKTMFKNVGPYSETQAAQSKAYDGGNALREDIRNVDPSVGALSDELKEAYGLKKAALGSAGKNPINSVLTSDSAGGLAKRSRLAAFDERAGSDLTGLGENISKANDKLKPIQLSSLVTPNVLKTVAKTAVNPIARSYDATAEVTKPILDKLAALLGKPAVSETINSTAPFMRNRNE